MVMMATIACIIADWMGPGLILAVFGVGLEAWAARKRA